MRKGNAFWGEECPLSKLSIGQYQIKAEKLKRKSISVSPDCLPYMFLAGEWWHMYVHISFRATVDLQTEFITSHILSFSSPICTVSTTLTLLQKRAPHNSDTVDLEKLIQLCCI